METSDWAVGVLKRMPKNVVSRALGAVSEVEFPDPVQSALNRSFAALADIDTDEARLAPEDYESLNDYFTRRLRDGARPIEVGGPGTLVSPVDGTVGAVGAVEDGTLFHAKGREYPLLELLDSAAAARWFSGGRFATFHIKAGDYHRVHSPVDGRVERLSYIPGHLLPANPGAADEIDNLFAINERLITYLQTESSGRVGIVKIGSTGVGRISLTFDSFETNGSFRRRREFKPESPVELSGGDEVAVFNLGSTVILLVEDPDLRFVDEIETGKVVRMGQQIAVSPGASRGRRESSRPETRERN